MASLVPTGTPLPDTITGPAVFAGDDASLTLGLLAGLRAARKGQPLLIVDGANAFDPFLVADLARKLRMAPRALLDEIRISRVFTCHQLEALLRGRLQQAVQRFRSPAVYFSGLLDPLLDEEVAAGEAVRIFRLIPPVLQRLASSGVLTVCGCPPPQQVPGRDERFTALCETAAWVFDVTRDPDEDVVRVVCRKPQAAEWRWEPQIGMVIPRRW
ncbi:MAG: hypothetical protein HYU43_07080 [Armatimonadetes bacterium]|nr:hypothetical protein [Armatimonadota bacterium]